VITVLGFLIVAISLVALANAITMSVLERTREIGILRCLGARGRDVRRICVTEGVALAVVGWIVGIPIGYALERVLVVLTNDVLDIRVPVVFPATNMLLALAGTVALALLVTVVPIQRAADFDRARPSATPKGCRHEARRRPWGVAVIAGRRAGGGGPSWQGLGSRAHCATSTSVSASIPARLAASLGSRRWRAAAAAVAGRSGRAWPQGGSSECGSPVVDRAGLGPRTAARQGPAGMRRGARRSDGLGPGASQAVP